MVETVARSEAAPRTCPDASVTPAEPTSPTSTTSPRNVDDMAKQLEQRKKNASQLAGGYTKEKQMMETVSIFTFTGIFARCLWKLQFIQSGEAGDQTSTFGLIVQSLLATFVALLAADFVGGFAHWLFDTWGTLEFPVFGPTFIRSFREHHVNPSALAHHDWREANGDNCLVVLIALIPLAFSTITTGSTHLGSGVLSLPVYIGLLWFILFVTLTNQIHKWAHMRPKDVPEWVKNLQARGVIMSRKHHNTHHSTFDAYYCITTGWMNYPLEYINFWRNLENMITLATGVQPRMDDLKWTAGFGTTDGLVKEQ